MERTSLRSLLMLGGGGGGGASNVVTGTFKGTESGAMDVDIPYTGSGYPIAALIFPKGGSTTGDIGLLAQKYAVIIYAIEKNDISETPTYDNTNASANKASVVLQYKNSDTSVSTCSSAQSYSPSVYNNADAEDTYNNMVKFKTDKKMSVYIASTSYGFAKDIEYTYYVIYSE